MADEEGASLESKGVESPDVVNKYKTAAEIVEKALGVVVKGVVTGASVVDLCALGDRTISESAGGVFNKAKTEKGEKIEKGIAFPTCVSVNNCICHFSPWSSDDKVILKEGDVVSIDLGCHIDGYISLAARSVVVDNAEATGRLADAMMAAYVAAEAVLRVLRPGKTNYDVTEVLNRAGNQFNCSVIEGSLSHQMKRFVIDGNRAIIGKPTYEHRVEEFTFEEHEVYGIDIAFSTGEGKPKELSARPTVFKRQVDVEYMLKLKAARQLFSEINAKSPSLPFTVRAFDERLARLGMVELVSHGLVIGYPVLYEKEGEYVGRMKFTAMIMPSQTICITPLKKPNAISEHEVTDPVLKDLLAQEIDKKKKKKKKMEEAAAGAAAAPATTTDGTATSNEAKETPMDL